MRLRYSYGRFFSYSSYFKSFIDPRPNLLDIKNIKILDLNHN